MNSTYIASFLSSSTLVFLLFFTLAFFCYHITPLQFVYKLN